MPKRLIKDRAVVDDRWTLVRDAAGDSSPPQGPVIVPLATWKARHDELAARADVGVWLAPSDDPIDVSADAATLPIIAVDFPQFTDGRGYSIGRLLRERYKFEGELRAIGDVQRDQIFYLSQCGFNAFAVREDRSVDDALSALDDFTDGYQLTNARTPWFTRRSFGETAARE